MKVTRGEEHGISRVVEEAYNIVTRTKYDCKLLLMDLADFTSEEDQQGLGFYCYNDDGDYRVRMEGGKGYDESLGDLDSEEVYHLVELLAAWY